MSLVTETLYIDRFAVIIAGNGRQIGRFSFKSFPWTALLCALYPVIFAANLAIHDLAKLWNWLPARDSPVLALQFVSTIWAVYAITLILQCRFFHKR